MGAFPQTSNQTLIEMSPSVYINIFHESEQ